MKPKKVEIEISTGNKNPVPAKDVIKAIIGFQELIYGIAEMKAALPLDKRGPKSKSLRHVCEMVITNVKPGSVRLEVAPREPELNLFGYDNFGNDVFTIGEEVLKNMSQNNTDVLKKMLPDEMYRNNIIGQAQSFIPKPTSESKMSLRSDTLRKMPINRMTKDNLQQVITPQDHLKKIYKTKFAEIKGVAVVDEADKFRQFDHIFQMTELKGISLKEVSGRKYIYHFSDPVFFEIDETDDITVLTQKDIDLLIYIEPGEHVKLALQNEFDFLWDEYMVADESNLHKSGLVLKKKLNKMISNRSIKQ